ncbi:MAG: AraC family transcriptional regulator [Bacteroidota bacterium]|nr:AraC family transcriptional regulator [Odoribacter sp.]MDP3643176.1 AraC family transcriptional regulator [Bacteroidota bacterium]
MKIMHEQVSFAPRTMLKVKWDDFPHFTYPWHFHSEFEIVYVLKSSGKRFVADSVEPFKEGDITLIGSNLPHFWKSEIQNDPDDSNRVNAIVVQFHKDFFKEEINAYPEFHRINELLKRAVRGVHFSNPSAEQIGKMLKRLLKLNGLDRMLYFIKLMDTMSRIENYRILASKAYLLQEHKELNTRLDKIMHFIITNYQRKITQEEVATKISMTTASFCRYFKEKTGKGFIFFVNEMRIGYACKLLIENHLSISQICFECGFNNISNFNRMFKRQTGYTPGEYQQQFIGVTV